MKKKLVSGIIAVFAISLTACAGNSTLETTSSYNYSYNSGSGSFEGYLKDNDSDSYDSYQNLEKNWDEGNWDSENGFYGNDNSTNETDSDFEKYLKENDPDSYDSYQKLEKNWNEGNWDPENGFFGD